MMMIDIDLFIKRTDYVWDILIGELVFVHFLTQRRPSVVKIVQLLLTHQLKDIGFGHFINDFTMQL